MNRNYFTEPFFLLSKHKFIAYFLVYFWDLNDIGIIGCNYNAKGRDLKFLMINWYITMVIELYSRSKSFSSNYEENLSKMMKLYESWNLNY